MSWLWVFRLVEIHAFLPNVVVDLSLFFPFYFIYFFFVSENSSFISLDYCHFSLRNLSQWFKFCCSFMFLSWHYRIVIGCMILRFNHLQDLLAIYISLFSKFILIHGEQLKTLRSELQIWYHLRI